MTERAVPTEWSELPLDTRILEALKDLQWKAPTAVQSACVPLALKGKDISIQSRTGSGKTGAFVIPAVQRLLTEREQRGTTKAAALANPAVLILVPSVELCEQTAEAASEIAKYVLPRLVIDNLTSGGGVTASRVQSAHVVVCTAALLARACNQGTVTAEVLRHVRFFVLDEADVVASMAERSLRTVQSVLPPNMQTILASATLTKGVAAVKGQLLRHPVNIVLTSEEVREGGGGASLKDADAAAAQSGPVVESRIVVRDLHKTTLHQYYLVATDECHSHTLLFGLYRMALITGKTLIFVNDDEQTYRLQNFLEQLGVATLAYDANLPINVRLDTLKRFQSGAVSTLVCTDGTLESAVQLQMSLEEDGTQDAAAAKGKPAAAAPRRRSRSGTSAHNSEEAPSALHRGIDFAHVRNVILFDGVQATDPIALSRYTHRIGRAGRAGEEGLSIAIFTVPQARKYLEPLRAYCAERKEVIQAFRQMQRAEVAKLQYRVDSVLENITRSSTRKMRVASVAAELSRSSYLSSHLSQKDTDALKRVMRRSSKKVRVERNILDMPEYMHLSSIDDSGEYRKRVRASQTQSSRLRKAARKDAVDPLKAVVAKLRSSKRKN